MDGLSHYSSKLQRLGSVGVAAGVSHLESAANPEELLQAKQELEDSAKVIVLALQIKKPARMC